MVREQPSLQLPQRHLRDRRMPEACVIWMVTLLVTALSGMRMLTLNASVVIIVHCVWLFADRRTCFVLKVGFVSSMQ